MAIPAYNYPTSPTAISAVSSEAIYTGLQFAQDNPQLKRQIMSRHSMQKTFYAMMKEMGLGSGFSSTSFAHYEQDWIYNNIQIGAVVTDAAGAGQSAVLALSNASMYANTVDGITSQMSFPAENDVIKLPDDTVVSVISKNVSVTPHQITVKPFLSSNNIAGKFVAGNRYWVLTNSFGEGTFGAAPKIPRTFRFSGIPQIIKSAAVETGSAQTDKLPVMNMENQSGSFMKVIAEPATEYLQMQRISNALLFGVPGDGNVQVTSQAIGQTVNVRQTQGLDDFITNRGTIYPYALGAMTLDDIDGFGAVFNRERVGSRDILILGSYALRTQLENTLKTYMNNTCFEYAKMNSTFTANNIFNNYASAEDFFLWLDFAGIRKSGFNYLLRAVPELDDPMGGGTTGYNWNGKGWIIPVETFKNKDGSNKNLPMAGYRYKELDGYNREYEVGVTGGAGITNKTTSLDAKAMDIRSEIGGEWGLGNHMIKIVGQ